MTDRPENDPWPGLPRLSDPMARRPVPSADDPAAQTLLEAIVSDPTSNHQTNVVHPRTSWLRRGALLGAVAAVTALLGATVVALGEDEADADALFVALDRTTALESGHLEIQNSRTVGDITVTDQITVRYRGDDEELSSRPDPSAALAELELGPGGFIPELLEVRTIDGDHYMRVVSSETNGRWDVATFEGPEPYVSFGTHVRAIVENGERLETCDGDAGVAAYCLTTTSSADVQQFIDYVVLSGTAELRVEIDDETGLLSSFQISATDVEFDDPGARFDRPRYDRVESRWRYEQLPEGWRPEVPDVTGN